MKTDINYGNAIVSIDVMGINVVEMRQMCELENRIAKVLISHISNTDADGNPVKRQYLSDDELRVMLAILYKFTKDYEYMASNAFDATLKELDSKILK